VYQVGIAYYEIDVDVRKYKKSFMNFGKRKRIAAYMVGTKKNCALVSTVMNLRVPRNVG
jgi:hypothetical protein